MHRFWTEADQPWLFLAACLEWKRYKEQGPGMISHLPISMDGSCNGYQHLSAMGLDPIGGRATNLIGFEDPEDIYQWVSDLVCRHMEIDAAGKGPNSEFARQLLAIMDRELAKNATMTTPYGVTLRTIYKALCEKDAIKALKDSEKCAMYLAKLLVECIPEVAVEAGRIMEWLREVAGIIAKANRGMMWTTPAGFVVIHENRKPKEVRLATADRMILVYHHDDKQKIDVRKQVGRHRRTPGSLDGCRSHDADDPSAVCRRYPSLRHGARQLRRPRLRRGPVESRPAGRIRPDLFRTRPAEFSGPTTKSHPGIGLPDPPQTGDRDIQQVLSSPYFFA